MHVANGKFIKENTGKWKVFKDSVNFVTLMKTLCTASTCPSAMSAAAVCCAANDFYESRIKLFPV